MSSGAWGYGKVDAGGWVTPFYIHSCCEWEGIIKNPVREKDKIHLTLYHFWAGEDAEQCFVVYQIELQGMENIATTELLFTLWHACDQNFNHEISMFKNFT